MQAQAAVSRAAADVEAMQLLVSSHLDSLGRPVEDRDVLDRVSCRRAASQTDIWQFSRSASSCILTQEGVQVAHLP